jgi:hypothetical protein
VGAAAGRVVTGAAGAVGAAAVSIWTGAVACVAAGVGDALAVVGIGRGDVVVGRGDCDGVASVAGAAWRTMRCGVVAALNFIASLAPVLRTATAATPTVTAAQRVRFAPFTRKT